MVGFIIEATNEGDRFDAAHHELEEIRGYLVYKDDYRSLKR